MADEIFWGHPVWWWARIGKILQLAGLATVVLELIGPNRLARLNQGIAQGRARMMNQGYGLTANLVWLVRWAIVPWILLCGLFGAVFWPFWIGALAGLVSYLAAWICLFWLSPKWPWMERVGTFVIAPAFFVLGFPAYWCALGAGYAISGLEKLFVYRRARLAASSISVVLIVGGFSLDLLAS